MAKPINPYSILTVNRSAKLTLRAILAIHYLFLFRVRVALYLS